ncbi:DUF58 domain-containing protein [Chitinophaga pinensis]|uniref:DUF58 domain-containing protein n=1 Tax=Chitinophaga pinensis (strain ATCC 43595 / DSM 2588 / LMG 13176 / NBRC 15968 / NCIMB 11800 / UQM 2034) TaxID=485918 RepID=A0A979G226_CHIPD|nr:DUF58 domain-containing protein [Chitinophaga pinensis]ACU59183.1 protein of unknown function DUF58 [Chitinophaga pinensis DSM 2588]
MLKRFFLSLFFTTRFYTLMGSMAIFFVVSFFFPSLYMVAQLVTAALLFLLLLDLFFLYVAGKQPLLISRNMAGRFSNGEENDIHLKLKNNYRFPVTVIVLEELPVQFQVRDFRKKVQMKPGEEQDISYTLRPVERGEYNFGKTNAFVRSLLGLAQRHVVGAEETIIKVYPSFAALHNYEFFSFNNRLAELGVHKKRVIGHSMEFDHIKEYTRGDDVRTLNWKATARRGTFMVNNYVEEKSQQVYCVIDKGRAMKMPFNGLSLLDYAINASLVFSNIALQKGDKTGLVTLAAQQVDVLPASGKKTQMNLLLERLYAQETRWEESDYERLSVSLRSLFSQRSLLILFTNFESMTGLQRQLPYLRKLAKYHLLLVVFFENTELKKFTKDNVHTVEDIYRQVIAQKFAYEKKLMVRELTRYGILSLLTTPEQLTLNVVNKYLELKSRSLI